MLTGCTSPSVKDYASQTPVFKLEEYFDGRLTATGVFQDRFGKLRRHFTVDITGTWDEETRTLTLDEDFVYNDGETEKRVWTIKVHEDGSYTGTADKVVGVATGEAAGNAVNWSYDFDLSVNGDIWRVHFDDWMYLLDDRRMFNKATIRRWGIRLGDVYLFFDKKS